MVHESTPNLAAHPKHLVEDSAAKSESLRRTLKYPKLSTISALRASVHAATARVNRRVFRVEESSVSSWKVRQEAPLAPLCVLLVWKFRR